MRSIHDEKLIYISDCDMYKVEERTDVYVDDCFGCMYSRSSPLLSPSAHCVLRANDILCGWGYVCNKYKKRRN